MSITQLTIQHTGEHFQGQMKPSPNISILCSTYSLIHFIQHMSTFPMPIPHHHNISATIQKCGPFFSSHLVHWMEVISCAHLHYTAVLHIEITKDSYLKIVSSHAISTFSLCLPILGGRGQRWMPRLWMQH